MSTINEILKKYNIDTTVPSTFGELNKFNVEEVTEHHTETHDGNEVHIFTIPISHYDDTVNEWILDLETLSLSKIVKKNGKNTYIGYESYEYIKDSDDLLISHY